MLVVGLANSLPENLRGIVCKRKKTWSVILTLSGAGMVENMMVVWVKTEKIQFQKPKRGIPGCANGIILSGFAAIISVEAKTYSYNGCHQTGLKGGYPIKAKGHGRKGQGGEKERSW